ncbi:DUF4232 domain-containing protein [Streptomyces rapamycinicus]|nr:DUF4232 domain-containing protein [Streptomyces rapamycinicus]MBB4783974.1 hypothetical protein [Streptomyces rapamycinicus]UTO64326.1 DUF4232 domain-containing protein [Streptomyces rapamycinicus]UTP32282.1 DUF4232 domain-containing protein [Streptomyces rapamycinicus NRRL 5491]
MSHRTTTLRHARKAAAAAVVAVAAFGLTACQDNADASGSSSSAAASDSSDSGSSGSGSSAGGNQGNGGAGGGGGAGADACKTSQLGFRSSHGMGEGQLIVDLKNNGSAPCTLQGFPGVDLKSKNGSISAERSDLAAPKTKVKPGEETRFTLSYPPNDSGGSGETFTTLVVTPPNETHSHSLPVSINVPVTDGTGDAIKVDPVGTGK